MQQTGSPVCCASFRSVCSLFGRACLSSLLTTTTTTTTAHALLVRPALSRSVFAGQQLARYLSLPPLWSLFLSPLSRAVTLSLHWTSNSFFHSAVDLRPTPSRFTLCRSLVPDSSRPPHAILCLPPIDYSYLSLQGLFESPIVHPGYCARGADARSITTSLRCLACTNVEGEIEREDPRLAFFGFDRAKHVLGIA